MSLNLYRYEFRLEPKLATFSLTSFGSLPLFPRTEPKLVVVSLNLYRYEFRLEPKLVR